MFADAPPIATDKTREELDSITRKIIGASQRIGRALGYGFLEKVYENALVHELRSGGLEVSQQEPASVHYGDAVVGNYVTDLLVERSVVVEIKAVAALDRVHAAQCVNYLRATSLRVCLLINFGRPRLEWQRTVHRF